jgi:hypothetical protein
MQRRVRVPREVAGTEFPCYADAPDREQKRALIAKRVVKSLDTAQTRIRLLEDVIARLCDPSDAAAKDAAIIRDCHRRVFPENHETDCEPESLAESRRDSEA